jgi:hypothetical protein
MANKGKRIKREKVTIEKMLGIYCRYNHQSQGQLCPDCQDLLAYASKRLDYCKFGEDKTTCGKCPIHCYKPDMRQKAIEIMRFSGPRMLKYHPILAVLHLVDELKSRKTKSKKSSKL